MPPPSPHRFGYPPEIPDTEFFKVQVVFALSVTLPVPYLIKYKFFFEKK